MPIYPTHTMMRFAFMGYRATNRLPLEEVAAVKAPG